MNRNYRDAEAQADASQRSNNGVLWHYYQRLLQTANGRYHVRGTNLNDIMSQNETTRFRPMRFREWLEQVWGPAL